ncbi:unnamed protein product [Alternaria alternata]
MSPPENDQGPIPVIDISRPSETVAQQVLDAASTHGFLYIKNDGVTIPPQDIDDMFKVSQGFFAAPKEHKSEFAIHSEKAGGINRGWVQMQGESLDPQGQKVKSRQITNRKKASVDTSINSKATQRKLSTSDLPTQPFNPYLHHSENRLN